jgi:hypothetical protein
MKINSIGAATPLAGTSESAPRSTTPPSGEAAVRATPQPRRDSVEISAEARELAALDADRAERIAIVQARIKQDFYSSASVQRDVARRLLGSGDV